MKVYKSPLIVSTMAQDDSSWFTGFDDKYFRDKGALLAANFPFVCNIGVYLQAKKNQQYTDKPYGELLKLYKSGIAEFKKKK